MYLTKLGAVYYGSGSDGSSLTVIETTRLIPFRRELFASSTAVENETGSTKPAQEDDYENYNGHYQGRFAGGCWGIVSIRKSKGCGS